MGRLVLFSSIERNKSLPRQPYLLRRYRANNHWYCIGHSDLEHSSQHPVQTPIAAIKDQKSGPQGNVMPASLPEVPTKPQARGQYPQRKMATKNSSSFTRSKNLFISCRLVLERILKAFFFASIGFSIPVTFLFDVTLVWRGLWLVRFQLPSPAVHYSFSSLSPSERRCWGPQKCQLPKQAGPAPNTNDDLSQSEAHPLSVANNGLADAS